MVFPGASWGSTQPTSSSELPRRTRAPKPVHSCPGVTASEGQDTFPVLFLLLLWPLPRASLPWFPQDGGGKGYLGICLTILKSGPRPRVWTPQRSSVLSQIPPSLGNSRILLGAPYDHFNSLFLRGCLFCRAYFIVFNQS